MDRQGFSNRSVVVVSQATPDNTAGGAKILSARPTRIQAIIQNKGAVDVFLAPTTDTATANAFYLKAATGVLIDNFSSGEWWAISASTAADLRIIECYEQ